MRRVLSLWWALLPLVAGADYGPLIGEAMPVRMDGKDLGEALIGGRPEWPDLVRPGRKGRRST